MSKFIFDSLKVLFTTFFAALILFLLISDSPFSLEHIFKDESVPHAVLAATAVTIAVMVGSRIEEQYRVSLSMLKSIGNKAVLTELKSRAQAYKDANESLQVLSGPFAGLKRDGEVDKKALKAAKDRLRVTKKAFFDAREVAEVAKVPVYETPSEHIDWSG